MRGIIWVLWPTVRYRHIRRLTCLLVRGMLITALLLIGSCPELLEMFPHRHLGVVEAGHDATPLEALEHLLDFDSDSGHHHAHDTNAPGVSLVSLSHGSLLGLNILIPSWLTLILISILIAELLRSKQEPFAGCTWPPLAPPPQAAI